MFLGVCSCVQVCGGMRGCRQVCVGVRGCAHGFVQKCVEVRGCLQVYVWDEFSEYLLENRVPTSVDFNTYPIRIFNDI